MATRKNTAQLQKTRDKIRVWKLIERLQLFVLGEKDSFGQEVNMSPAQVKAAQVLIAKQLPDLTASDVNLITEKTESKEEMYEKLVESLGPDMAAKIAPEFAGKTLN